MKLFGIANCDTVKKARAWLNDHGVAYEWIDFRKTPPARTLLMQWSRVAGWQALLNRRGITWRQLDPATQSLVSDEASAIALMAAKPTLIRRPVIHAGDALILGFDPDDYARRFAR
jgi:Spx/MgsR family transcriptional regulator